MSKRRAATDLVYPRPPTDPREAHNSAMELDQRMAALGLDTKRRTGALPPRPPTVMPSTVLRESYDYDPNDEAAAAATVAAAAAQSEDEERHLILQTHFALTYLDDLLTRIAHDATGGVCRRATDPPAALLAHHADGMSRLNRVLFSTPVYMARVSGADGAWPAFPLMRRLTLESHHGATRQIQGDFHVTFDPRTHLYHFHVARRARGGGDALQLQPFYGVRSAQPTDDPVPKAYDIFGLLGQHA